MSLCVAIAVLVVLAIFVLAAIVRTSRRNAAIAPWQLFLTITAICWAILAVAKEAYFDPWIGAPDAELHEMLAREVAATISRGDVQGIQESFGMGNAGYRFLLGSFYAFTQAPEVCVYWLQGALIFTGMLSVLEVLCRHSRCERLPWWAMAFSFGAPTILHFGIANLKDGLMLWSSCMLLRFTLRWQPSIQRETLVLPALGLLVGGFLRAHIAMGWTIALAAGALAKQRRFSTIAVVAGWLLLGQLLLHFYSPDMSRQFLDAGYLETMDEFYESRNALGGSAIQYARGAPTPVLSGLVLLIARPLPTDVFNASSLVAGLEIWCFTLMAIVGWVRLRDRTTWVKHPLMIALLIGLVGFSFYFSYMYNMGLMVRQRVQIYPLLMVLSLLPWFVPQRRTAPLNLKSLAQRQVMRRSRTMAPAPRAAVGCRPRRRASDHDVDGGPLLDASGPVVADNRNR
jgi:hypothetical protein